MQFVDLKAQYQAYQSEIDTAMAGVFEHCQFIMGPEVEALEHSLVAYTGASHAISCASGTDALLLALMAIGVGPGDEVITTPLTFVATVETIALLGAKPVFVDIQPDTYNIDPAKVEAAITQKTRAIIPVALYGQPADMDEINAIAAHASHRFGQKLWVIEDAAQSFGAEYRGQKSCHLSDIGVTSFFPAKPLGCYGDGGALFTDDVDIARRVSSMRIHGQHKRYHHDNIGINGRLDTLQAAILLVKLRHLDDELQQRRAIAAQYDEALSGQGVHVPQIRSDRTTAYAQYSVQVADRDAVQAELKAVGVPTAIHYPVPMHLQAAYANLGCQSGDFPIAEAVSSQILSLPMSAFLSREDQMLVIDAAVRLFHKKTVIA